MAMTAGAQLLDDSAARAAAAVDPLQRAYLLACLDELRAPKPGNVSIYSPGHGMTALDFARSAEASAPALCDAQRGLGARVLGAVRGSWAVAGCNTNLGIVLLAAPLLMAAQQTGGGAPLRDGVRTVLRQLDVSDTQGVFEAIRTAAPAGLGDARQHDVHEPAMAPLREVMESASAEDRIARQYSHDYVDVFELGVPALQASAEQYTSRKWQVVALYLGLLAWIPDTHIRRKFGADEAASVQKEARSVRESLRRQGEGAAALAMLREFDARLKARGVNPGTTADLTVATLLVSRLAGVVPSSGRPST
ncbi:MAG: triphosphoribosyl-dephospho-CoA synthase [Pseudomonadota bacterium]